MTPPLKADGRAPLSYDRKVSTRAAFTQVHQDKPAELCPGQTQSRQRQDASARRQQALRAWLERP